MMMMMIRSSETSVITKATWRNNPEEGILYTYLTNSVELSTTGEATSCAATR
jgi:hypothetical protein